eukprot:8393672-Pyramimonas_sp.AAC.1
MGPRRLLCRLRVPRDVQERPWVVQEGPEAAPKAPKITLSKLRPAGLKNVQKWLEDARELFNAAPEK